jgi:hypothetical protein
MMSPRRAFGLALKALGAADPSVVALDADVKNSTYALDFAETYPDRYFEARIAEQNMILAAAGLSSGGMVPFASTFGRFLERALDQIEMAIVGGANIKLVGTHVGVTLASDGPSQMALADITFMRAFLHSTDHRGNPAITVPDYVERISERSLRPVGRRDGAVQVTGHNVSPERVAQTLQTVEGVVDAAVRLHANGRLKAFIVLKEDYDPAQLSSRIEQAMVIYLADHERPKSFRFGPALPRNAMGKLEDWP